jgi:hypothetical protein
MLPMATSGKLANASKRKHAHQVLESEQRRVIAGSCYLRLARILRLLRWQSGDGAHSATAAAA